MLVDDFLAARRSDLKDRYAAELERHLRHDAKSLQSLPLSSIDRSAIARLVSTKAKSAPVAADRLRAALSSFFAWAVGEGRADGNPVIGTNRPVEPSSRDRVLSDLELGEIWRTAREGADDYGHILRLLILTGQRREEVGGPAWSELSRAGVWSLPASRTKNSRPHDVPLSVEAQAILAAVPRRSDRDLLFGAREARSFSGWSKGKAALDHRILAASEHAIRSPPPMSEWRLHDLRRTVATGMADLGLLPHVIEAVLNHVSGHKAGVAGVYNRSTYAKEKADALDRWGAHVASITGGTL